jgi:hypothetical protein
VLFRSRLFIVYHLALSTDGQFVLTGHLDGHVILWRVR